MLRILGRGSKLCDGVNRREVLRAGALSLFGGLTLPRLLRAQETVRRPGHAKSVIMFNLLGGPSHQDMVDLKPNAPIRRPTWSVEVDISRNSLNRMAISAALGDPEVWRLDPPGFPIGSNSVSLPNCVLLI